MNTVLKDKIDNANYPFIAYWGFILGSYEYYINSEKAKAKEQNAPLTAIYFSDTKKEWVTAGEVNNTNLIHDFDKLSQKLFGIDLFELEVSTIEPCNYIRGQIAKISNQKLWDNIIVSNKKLDTGTLNIIEAVDGECVEQLFYLPLTEEINGQRELYTAEDGQQYGELVVDFTLLFTEGEFNVSLTSGDCDSGNECNYILNEEQVSLAKEFADKIKELVSATLSKLEPKWSFDYDIVN